MSLDRILQRERDAKLWGRREEARRNPKSTCYDCRKRQPRASTKVTHRTNTQGKSARVRVCAQDCPKEIR